MMCQLQFAPYHIHSGFTDVNECMPDNGVSPCAANATCYNIPGSYFCLCDSGFTGDGSTGCTGEYTFLPSYSNLTYICFNDCCQADQWSGPNAVSMY